ncbi:MAG TPA: rhodanese-like domain-containing protein [Usitatibacter sp.]|nr:rhodanese-like domain-containing protein [Usitatibacter sp.]
MDPKTLKAWLHDGREIALLDIREHGRYGESHLFFGVPLPFSRLEADLARLVPRRGTRIVVYDDGVLGVAEHAASRLGELGYTEVRVLEGGTAAWARAGYTLFAGVNVPSKAFGELVEHERHTPRVSAAELAALQRDSEDVVVIDGRPLSEFRKMSIPGATCCPNGELAYRIHAIVPDPETRIVVNCAGRTRSIVGAQTLIDLGIPNPVFALENGTQGWYLSDFPLEHGALRAYPAVADDARLETARARARALAERYGVRFAADADIERDLADPSRTVYLLDVRTPEEYAAGSLPGAVHAPGGQLLQATDQWIAVRNARIVVVDGDGVRAPVIASWLARMGHDACVLERGTSSGIRAAREAIALPDVPPIGVDALVGAIGTGEIAVVDVRSSMAYRKGHVPGSTWSIRPRFGELVRAIAGKRVVLVSDEPVLARIAAFDLARAGIESIAALAGGFAAWRDAGPPVDATPRIPPDDRCIDYLFFVHDRHEGNKEAARRYLAWETQLLSQLDPQERASYRL